jgi:hypothetical protein
MSSQMSVHFGDSSRDFPSRHQLLLAAYGLRKAGQRRSPDSEQNFHRQLVESFIRQTLLQNCIFIEGVSQQ